MKAKLAFIAAQKTRHSVRRLCAVLGVSRAWVYGAAAPKLEAQSCGEGSREDNCGFFTSLLR